jgi:hypothetical protein
MQGFAAMLAANGVAVPLRQPSGEPSVPSSAPSSAAPSAPTVSPSEIQAGRTWAGINCFRCGVASPEPWMDVICNSPACHCFIRGNGDNAMVACLKCILFKRVPGFFAGMTRKDIESIPIFDHRSVAV